MQNKSFILFLIFILTLSCKSRFSKLSENDPLSVFNKPFMLGENFVGNMSTYPQINQWLEEFFKTDWENTTIVGTENGRMGYYRYKIYLELASTSDAKKPLQSPIQLVYELNTQRAPNLARTFLMLIHKKFFEHQATTTVSPPPHFSQLFSNLGQHNYMTPFVIDNPKLTTNGQEKILPSATLQYALPRRFNTNKCPNIESLYDLPTMPLIGKGDFLTDRIPMTPYFLQLADGLLTPRDLLSQDYQNYLEPLDMIMPTTEAYNAGLDEHFKIVGKVRGMDAADDQQPASSDEDQTTKNANLDRARKFGSQNLEDIQKALTPEEITRLKKKLAVYQQKKSPSNAQELLEKKPELVDELKRIPDNTYHTLKVNPLQIMFNLTGSLANYYCNFSMSPPALLAKNLNQNKLEIVSILQDHLQDQDLYVQKIWYQNSGFVPFSN